MLGVYFCAVLLTTFDVCFLPQPRAWAKRLAVGCTLRAVRNRASRLLVVTLAWRGY